MLRKLIELLLKPDPKLRPEAASIPTLPLSVLKMPNFEERFTYNDGSGKRYEGQWEKSMRHGYGILYYSNGEREYEG